ncbi:MAG: type VI secretion system lipoprotein TssJ [Burkholderiales bacterium]|nr:type VI secretion system lipoprotein TssJ [Burkholderiales bacterium]
MLATAMLVGLVACASKPPAGGGLELDRLGDFKSESSSSPIMESLGAIKDKALEAVGLKKPELPELPNAALPDRKVVWRLHASDSLNVSASGQSVALLTRIYKLRSPNAFMQAPYEVFGDPEREKKQLGDDLIETRDVQLIPGQHDEVLDKVVREARYVGVVALFRNPAAQRWRYAFRSESAEKTGLSMGLHACAMSVQIGEPIGMAIDVARSAAVSCPP